MLRKSNQNDARTATVRRAKLRRVRFDIVANRRYGCAMPIRSWEVDQARLRDPKRLAALRSTRLLDSAPEPAFDRLTREASSKLDAPISLVSLVDDERQFFKSATGQIAGGVRETPLSQSLCKFAVSRGEPVVIDDVFEHAELREAADIGVRAYAGAPLTTSDGHVLGALCVIDSRPRDWTEDQVEALTAMAAEVVAEIERR